MEEKSKRDVLIERHKSWVKPEPKENSYRTGLKFNNSLWPIDPVEFIPENGKTVNWYTCGPTVYSDSHLGHARCYLVCDILRRVLRDYFHYDVNYVMNITDIDDKIINKAIDEGVNFNEVARKWEKDYFENMKLIGVQPPNRIVRVTEYVPEIVKYIENLIKNGFAYEAKGSVYFSVDKFREAGHAYCKLEPTSFNEENKDNEGNEDKRYHADFALWKKKKRPEEPSWESPWGEGRPGWHIECSAMIHEVFGGQCPIDIHYGGADLKFPHHDNEIAQAEGFYKSKQWINYFIHNGQLYNKGQKMSKSLKNYKTIRDILQNHSAREMRLLFLNQTWDSLLNFDPETSFVEVSKKDHVFHQFMLNAQSILRKGLNLEASQKFDEQEDAYDKDLQKRQNAIHEHLCNNIATHHVIDELTSLVKNMNIYMKSHETSVKYTLLYNYYTYVSTILTMFGLDYSTSDNVNNEDAYHGVIEVLREFRDGVINAAGQKEPKLLFDLSDKLRDEVLPHHGIKIEDKGKGKPSTWKLQNKDELLKEIETKKLEAQKAKEEKEKRAKELEEKMKREPKEIFNDEEYKKFAIAKYDDKGIPTHNEKGDEFPSKVRSKFEKDYAKQEKLRQDWLSKHMKKEEMNEK